MRINLILASDLNGIISFNNTIPWNCKNDLKGFKQLTDGHYILMGHKTFDSLPKLLPNRKHIIISSDNINNNKIDVFDNITDGINFAHDKNEEELFIIGDAFIYSQCINMCDIIYYTHIKTSINNDTKFKFNDDNFIQIYHEKINKEDFNDEYDSEFFVYKKI